jgi:hypothetical protein
MLATPVRERPALRMNSAHTVTTAELLNPERVSAGVRIPARARQLNTTRPTRSTRMNSVINSRIAIPRMARVITISEFTSYPLSGIKYW